MSRLNVGSNTPLSNASAEVELRISTESSDLFDILCVSKVPDANYAGVWKTSPLQYGLYVEAGIPFFLVDLSKEGKTYAMPLNVFASQDAAQWLGSKGVSVHLFLVNVANNVIQAQRTFSANSAVADELRKCSKDQQTKYKTAAEVAAAISKISNSKAPKIMIAASKMYSLMQA